MQWTKGVLVSIQVGDETHAISTHFLGMDVPQGAPGSNPGDISSDTRLDNVAAGGTISVL